MASNLNIRQRSLKAKNGAKDLFGGASDIPAFVGDEELFTRLLSLERKRTERTGDPFILMILDISLLDGCVPQRQIGEMCDAIRTATRDTDVHGWYAFPSMLGSIFTASRNDDRTAVLSALERKIETALHRVLQPVERSNVRISYHFYPEDFEDGKPILKSDEKLYPDLHKQDRSRIIYHGLKRAIDIGGSLFGLALFSPLFLVISALIKFTSEGPVFFRQRRIGRFGQEFWFLKFRTMYVNNDPDIHQQYVTKLITAPREVEVDGQKPLYKIGKDPRVTRLGSFLRKTSFDELPQFINVLRGEMSLVGPRPPIPYEVACYRSWHRRRLLEVKPGITGLWQVYGRSRTTFDEMVRLDLRYVQQQSLWLDLKILLKTPVAVLSGQGAV
jgi:lipopolysaccharide/colanic/teichoic acid biosynthesis glycosyltransferase